MLTGQLLTAFVPTLNAEKAKSFYQDILGLKLVSEDPYALEFKTEGGPLRVITVPELKPQAFTVLGWKVEDIFSTVKALNEKKIYCEKYAYLEQDDLGIWISPGRAKVAWFRDPDGNLLSLTG